MNFKMNAVVFTILICIFFSISCVAATDVNDTEIAAYENQIIGNVTDEVIASSQGEDLISSSNEEVLSASQEDNLISASNKGTFKELQELITDAPNGATISLDKDYSYDTGFNDGRGIIIAKNLTINGNGHTLDGLSKSRIFFVMSGVILNNKVTLNNIVFKNGFTKLYGGAIVNFADLTVNKCTFEKNYAGTTAGAICSVGSLDCKNSNFNKNTANGSGGAIFSLNYGKTLPFYKYANLTLNILDDVKIISDLMKNTSLIPSTDKISNCKFSNNVALGRGGGAVYAYTHISIVSSTFTSNKADQVGGAVYAAKNLNIKNSKFTKNKAGVYGGAVYFKFHELAGSYDKNGNWKTTAKFYTGVIEKCTFTENVAKDRGGAVYGFKYSGKPKASAGKVVKCTFKNNQADTYNEVYGAAVKNCKYKNTVTLKTVKVKKSAKKLVLTAILKNGNKALKYKKVTFKFNGKIYKAKTNSKGVAKVTIKSKVLNLLRVNSKIFYQVTYGKLHVKKIAKVYK